MSNYYSLDEIKTYTDKRVLKDTLYRFSYMSESKLIKRVGRMKKKEKILATILVANKLSLPEVERAAVVKLYAEHGDYYTGNGQGDPGRRDQVVYKD